MLVIFKPTEVCHKNSPFPVFRICVFSGFDSLANEFFIFMLEVPCEVLWSNHFGIHITTESTLETAAGWGKQVMLF